MKQKYLLLIFLLAIHHHIYSTESNKNRKRTSAELLGNISNEQRNRFYQRQLHRQRNGSLTNFQKLGPIEEKTKNRRRVRRRVRVRAGSAPATVLEDITSKAINLNSITSKIVALEKKIRENSKRTTILEGSLEKIVDVFSKQIEYLDDKTETLKKQSDALLKVFMTTNDNIIPMYKKQQEHSESINEHGEFLKFMLECLIPLIKKEGQQVEAISRFSSLLGNKQ